MRRLQALLRITAAAGMAAAAVSLSLPATASAHPLGNFTVNRYDGLTIAPTWAHLDRVVDLAELPTVQARQEMDLDRDEAVTNTEAAAWASQTCVAGAQEATLAIGGRGPAFRPLDVGISFPAGQAGLPTLRLVCTYSAPLDEPVAPDASVTFADTSFGDRPGWREIVVSGRGLSLTGLEHYARSASDRLRSYPSEAGTTLSDQSSAQLRVAAVTDVAIEGFPVVADSVPLGSSADSIVASMPLAGAVPGGTSDLPFQISALLQAEDLSPIAIAVALFVAGGVGAFHAATPGHGKTLMAAYLVGARGTVRHAFGLGLTVTITHTIGVMALGVLIIGLGAKLPALKLFPILGLVSGVIVTLLGIAFLVQRIRARRGRGHEHEGGHDHDEGAGWHSHGGARHTHLPAADGPLRRRNLVALGLVGGLVPSASAVLILVGSIAAGRPAFGLLLTVAFGAGMAFVLVGVGVLLVRARSLVERLASRRLDPVFAYAPMVTAITFVVVGAAITFQSGAQLR